jgi:hypothetical protein
MFLSGLAITLALFVGYYWGKEVTKAESRKKNFEKEPAIFTLQHDAWKKAGEYLDDFIKSLESDDIKLIRETRDNLNHEISESFNKKAAQLKRLKIIVED